MTILYILLFIMTTPVWDNSNRKTPLKAEPINAANVPKKKYKVPISLWLVDISHRKIKVYLLLNAIQVFFIN